MKLNADRTMLYKICFGCPEGKPLEECSLQQYRKEPVNESLKKISQLSAKEVRQLTQKCRQCIIHHYEGNFAHLSKSVVNKKDSKMLFHYNKSLN